MHQMRGSLMVEHQSHKLNDGSSILSSAPNGIAQGTLWKVQRNTLRPAGCIEYGGTMPPVNDTSRDVKGDAEMKRSDSNV